MMWSSTAASWPPYQFGIRTSAGHERELGTSVFASQVEARAVASKWMSLIELCQAILSELPGHAIWWSPKGSQLVGDILGKSSNYYGEVPQANTVNISGIHDLVDIGQGQPKGQH